MSNDTITNFAKRSELLSTVVSNERDRVRWLDDALEQLTQLSNASVDNTKALVAPIPREIPLSNSWMSINPNGLLDDNAVAQRLHELHEGLLERRRVNDSLRREVYGWHQRHIVLSQAYRNMQKHRTTSEQQRLQLAGSLSSVERMLQQWKSQLSQLSATRENLSGGSSPSAAARAEERDLERSLRESEERVNDVRSKRAALESKLSTSRDSVQDIEADIERLKERYQREIHNRHNTGESQSPPVEDNVLAASSALRKEIEGLETNLEQAKRQQARFLNSYTAKFIAATMFPPSDRLPAHMERRIQELRAQSEDVHKISEAMELLKSTIVHFDSDLKKLRTVQRLVEGELENVFKVSHNELKVVVTMCLPKEDVRRFSRAGHTGEEWPLTQHMLEEKFPAHKLETVNEALQNMVVAWDGMSQDSKARLTTAQDVVVNAHLLFMIACYVSLKRTQKWALKYQQVMDTRLPRAAGGVGYL
jgi:DNA repair exonuclease SbcCD ATPase subunit